MSDLSLKDLHERIAKQNAELQRLRQELEARQSQFASLNQRRQVLQVELQQVEKELATVANGKKGTLIAPRNVLKKKHGAKPSVVQKETTQLSLPALIASIVREASGPVTAQQLIVEVKQRGFKSKSANFANMLKTRTYELVKKGLLQRAGDTPGFIPAKSNTKTAQKAKQAK
jgi:hypothetical protein